MIVIVDYGAGNLNSVKKAFDHLGAEALVTKRSEDLTRADKIVLPGVGHFSSLRVLEEIGLRNYLLQGITTGKPFLGICLGMQWLFEGSEECTDVRGSGILPGICRQFPSSRKSPHVGWNSLSINKPSRLCRGIAPGSFVYYTHSFYAPLVAATAANSEYGFAFSAAVEQTNVFGLQFHPEKSSDVGLSILRNFCEIESC